MSKIKIQNAITGQVREIAVPARPRVKSKSAAAPTQPSGDKGKGAGKSSG